MLLAQFSILKIAWVCTCLCRPHGPPLCLAIVYEISSEFAACLRCAMVHAGAVSLQPACTPIDATLPPQPHRIAKAADHSKSAGSFDQFTLVFMLVCKTLYPYLLCAVHERPFCRLFFLSMAKAPVLRHCCSCLRLLLVHHFLQSRQLLM